MIISGLLAGARLFSRRPSPQNQFLYDMLGVWTVLELILIVVSDLDPAVTGLAMPNVVEVIRSNGALLPFALTYCAFAVCQSTLAPTVAQLRASDKGGE